MLISWDKLHPDFLVWFVDEASSYFNVIMMILQSVSLQCLDSQDVTLQFSESLTHTHPGSMGEWHCGKWMCLVMTGTAPEGKINI